MPFGDLFLEVLVGGGEHADVRLERLIATDAAELAFLQHAQELALHGQRHVADFIEEERAAVALLEAADALATAPVKAPFSWPKSSLSRRLSGMAVTLMATNSFCVRGLNLWMARATSSLPQPLSPVIMTAASERETRPMSLKTSCIAPLSGR